MLLSTVGAPGELGGACSCRRDTGSRGTQCRTFCTLAAALGILCVGVYIRSIAYLSQRLNVQRNPPQYSSVQFSAAYRQL